LLRRFGLACFAPRFRWECLINQTVSWFPAPATSNRACRFPALGSPARFTKAYGTSPVSSAFDPGSYPKPTPRPSDLFRLPLAVYPLISGLADYWAFYQAPLPPLPSWGTAWQQGSFAPRTLLRFSAPTSPSATVSPSATFPVSPVIGPTLLHRFRGGTRTASPVAWPALVTVLSLIPRRNVSPLQSACDDSCCLRPMDGGSASGARSFEATSGFTCVTAR